MAGALSDMLGLTACTPGTGANIRVLAPPIAECIAPLPNCCAAAGWAASTAPIAAAATTEDSTFVD